MGLGKTLQTLAFFQYVKQSGSQETVVRAPCLVVAPLSVLGSWMAEVAKWCPDLRVVKYHGTKEQRLALRDVIKGKAGHVKRLDRQQTIWPPRGPTAVNAKSAAPQPVDIVVTSYEVLTADIAWIRCVFLWKCVVLDEGHRIKNCQAQKSRALMTVRAEHKLVLTG